MPMGLAVMSAEISALNLRQALTELEQLEHKCAAETPSSGVITNVAVVSRMLGDHEQAKMLLERMLALEDDSACFAGEKLAVLLLQLGTQCGELGDTQHMIQYLRRALEIQERVGGLDHRNLADILTNLGVGLGKLGDFESARDHLLRALAIRESCFGLEHPAIANTLMSLATACDILGESQRAHELLCRTLAIMEQEDDVLSQSRYTELLTQLCVLSGKLGKYGQMDDLMNRVLALQAPPHALLSDALTELAQGHVSGGYCEQAVKMYERVLAIRERQCGANSREVAIVLSDLSAAYARSGNHAQATTFLERSLAIQGCKHSDGRPSLAALLAKFGVLGGDCGDSAQMLKRLECALVEHECVHGYCQQELPHTIANPAAGSTALGDAASAARLLGQALATVDHVPGHANSAPAKTLVDLGSALFKAGELEMAQPCLERARLLCEQQHGPLHLEVATPIMLLSRLHSSMGHSQRAALLLERTLAIKERHFGVRHPELAPILAELSGMSRRCGDLERARRLVERGLALDSDAALGRFPHRACDANCTPCSTGPTSSEASVPTAALSARIVSQSHTLKPDCRQSASGARWTESMSMSNDDQFLAGATVSVRQCEDHVAGSYASAATTPLPSTERSLPMVTSPVALAEEPAGFQQSQHHAADFDPSFASLAGCSPTRCHLPSSECSLPTVFTSSPSSSLPHVGWRSPSSSDQPLVDEATCVQRCELHIDESYASLVLPAASSVTRCPLPSTECLLPTVESGVGLISDHSLSLREPRWRRTCSAGRRSTVCYNELPSAAAANPAQQAAQACEDHIAEPPARCLPNVRSSLAPAPELAVERAKPLWRRCASGTRLSENKRM